MSYKENREWSDGYMPSVKSILGQAMIKESTFKEDTELGFDLVTPSEKEIACRVRDYEKYKYYINEFTIRSKSKYDKRTEIHKILDGCGDWFFYGFTKGDEVKYWSIINLDVFRNNYENSNCKEMSNPCDGTKFISFKFLTFPPDIIIDSNIDHKFNNKGIVQ